MDELIPVIWRFIRGNLAVNEFEQWVYKTPEIEKLLGNSLYFDLLVCNYQEKGQIWEIKKKLQIAIDRIYLRKCKCITWKDDQKVPISADTGWESISEDFTVLVNRTPWLQLSRCKNCGQYWYVASDTFDDDYYLYRLGDEEAAEITQKGIWPAVFDLMKVAWPDQKWLKVNGYKSLGEWQMKNNVTGEL